MVAPFRANGECAGVVRDLHVHVGIADIRHAFDWHVERFRDEREAFRVGLARHGTIAKREIHEVSEVMLGQNLHTAVVFVR